MLNSKKIRLELEDGSVFYGRSFGYKRSVSGEVVFNTAMTGYPESLTDPSYKGQILVATYPLIGNYGVPEYIKEHGLLKYFESDRIHVSGLIIADYSFEYSHWCSDKNLANWLSENKIPGVYGVDTRALTKKLREEGTMLGKIIFNDDSIDLYDPGKDNTVEKVSIKEKVTYGTGRYKVILVDCGVKNNIIRCLLKRDITVVRVPWDYDYSDDDHDGIMLSNGPGDPKACKDTINILAKVLKKNKPVLGICLGSQLMALAAGADTYKLKYGHRSHNQPVMHKGTNRCYITSQNHGYATDINTLGNEWDTLFINVNDSTCEGIKHKSKPFFSSQFHPEASGGPTDTEFLFDEFVELVERYKVIGV